MCCKCLTVREAAAEYEKALSLEPEAGMPTVELAKSLDLVENGSEAIGLLKKLLVARRVARMCV